jgi:hypothetical protein
MASQPYIPFYTGDYIKDTRKLPLAVRGAWMDLLLFMWDEEIRGEITGTIQEFAGMLSCSVEECQFALNLLKQKKTCSYEDFPDGRIKIISRRMKRDVDISLKRSESGKKGVIAKHLLQQNKEFASANRKQIPDIDNIYDNDIKNSNLEESKVSNGESALNLKTKLPSNVLETAELNQYTLTGDRNTEFIKDHWKIFIRERLNESEGKQNQYFKLSELTGYFLNWIRNKHPKQNGTHKPIAPAGGKSAGANEVADRLAEKIAARGSKNT